jgi:3-hydroxyisobutyrate dehydrogenase-like beta-hydroxyacid dehydrogenase
MSIAFIGIGKMGLPMVRLLLRAGHAVCVCDPDPAQVRLAREAGASDAASVAGCVRGRQAIFTSLPDDRTLRAVALGPEGIVQAAGAQAVYVDTSTVSAAVSAELAAAALARGLAYVRMPVSGNALSAQSGQLTALASGPQAAWQQVRPLVECFTTAQVYVGEAEQARYMKLVINLLVANMASLLAEALTLGRHGGLEWSTMLDALAQSTLASPWLRAKAAQLKPRDFAPTFTPDQLSKDLGLMLEAADQHGVPLPLTAVTRQLMKAVVNEGYGQEDFIAVVKLFERLSGLPVDTV